MNRLSTILITLCVLLATGGSPRSAIPGDPLTSFAWTNATSAIYYNGFVLATTSEGIMSFINGFPASHVALPSTPRLLRQYGNLLLILTQSNVMYLVDINDAGGMSIVTHFDPGGTIEDIAFDNFTIYLARGFDGLERYSFNIHGGFDWIDSSQFPIHCTDLVLKDSLLFAVDDYNGIVVYNTYCGTLDQIVDFRRSQFQINKLVVFDTYVAATSEDDVLIGGVFNWEENRFQSFDSITSFRSNDLYVVGNIALAIADDSMRFIRWMPHSGLKFTFRSQLSIPIRPSIAIGTRSQQNSSNAFAASQNGTILTFSPTTDFPVAPSTQYTYTTGPYSCIELADSNLYVGGSNYPLQRFRLSSLGQILPPKFVIPGMVNVRDFDLRNDSLLVLSPADQSLMIYSLANPEDPLLLRRISIDTNRIREAHFIDWPTDALTAISASGDNQVYIYTIRDTLPTVLTSHISIIGRVLDYAIADSFLIILSNKKMIDVYRLKSDLTSSFRGSTSVAGQASHFFLIKEPENLFSSAVERLFLVSGQTISRLDLSAPGSPFFDLTTNVDFSISKTTVAGDTMYAVGLEGLARFDISGQFPVLSEIGGRPGQFITREGELVATSSGESVQLYSIPFDVPTDVGDDEPVEATLPVPLLAQNWPNPFNPATSIPYTLPVTGLVRLSVYNILGQEVTTLVNESQSAGSYTIEWNGRNIFGQPVASGLYLYRLELSNRTESRKMMLVR